VSDDLSPLAEFLLAPNPGPSWLTPKHPTLIPPAVLDMSVQNFLPRQKPLATETTWNKPFAMDVGGAKRGAGFAGECH